MEKNGYKVSSELVIVGSLPKEADDGRRMKQNVEQVGNNFRLKEGGMFTENTDTVVSIILEISPKYLIWNGLRRIKRLDVQSLLSCEGIKLRLM